MTSDEMRFKARIKSRAIEEGEMPLLPHRRITISEAYLRTMPFTDSRPIQLRRSLPRNSRQYFPLAMFQPVRVIITMPLC